MLRMLAIAAGLTLAWAGLLTYAADRQAPGGKPPTPAPPQAEGFDSSRAWEHLRQIVAHGPRPSGSEALRQTRAYITRQIAALGLTVQEQTFTPQTPNGPVEMVNLIVRLPGKRPDRILITGHYDTKLLRDVTFVGANDAGSSSAFLIELARALKDRPREFTYELVWFDGEEAVCAGWDDCGNPKLSEWMPGQSGEPDNTYGSRRYVNEALKANAVKSVRAMILVDMIGERNPQFMREATSTAWLKDIIWGTAKELGHGKTFLDSETPIGDDHLPFLKAGIPAVDIIDLDYPHWHQATDTLDKLAARSLQVVGDVLVASLPKIEKRLLQ